MDFLIDTDNKLYGINRYNFFFNFFLFFKNKGHKIDNNYKIKIF